MTRTGEKRSRKRRRRSEKKIDSGKDEEQGEENKTLVRGRVGKTS